MIWALGCVPLLFSTISFLIFCSLVSLTFFLFFKCLRVIALGVSSPCHAALLDPYISSWLPIRFRLMGHFPWEGLPEHLSKVLPSQFWMDMYTGLHLKWITSKDLLYSTENSAQYISLDERRVWGRMDTCICMAEFLGWSPETITALFFNQLYSDTK